MGTQSSLVKKLSEEDLEQLNKILSKRKRPTGAEILGWLDGLGYEVSKSALGRYAQSFTKTTERIRQSQAVMEAFTRELGDSAVEGEQGRVLVQMVRTLAFDCLTDIMEEDGKLSPKGIADLGKGLRELSLAARSDQDFETKVRDRVEKETKEAAAKAVGKMGKTKGLTKETLDAIVGAITGDGG